jgi:ankyrin repeat protein/mono/diheme cytochrome c family protein
MAAALCADAGVLELVLKAGAEVNAVNQEGATALMRAASFEEKARMLVAAGAEVKARSKMGNTALHIAARQHGNVRTVGLLLDRGAEVNAANVFGATPLMAAAAAEDPDTVRLLLDRGADVNAKPNTDGGGFIWGGGRTPLMWAAFRRNEPLAKLLLERGAKVSELALIGSALTQAAWAGNARMAALLLDAGAQVDQRDLVANFTPLHWAASSERSDAALLELLLSRRADANAEGGQPVDNFLGVAQTPLMLARRRGETPIVKALLKSGARETLQVSKERATKPARSIAGPIDTGVISDSIRLAIAPLQKTAVESQSTFLRHTSKQDCISCHQQQLPSAAITLARARHIAVDEPKAQKQIEGVVGFGVEDLERDLQTTFHPEPAIGHGYGLLAMHLEKRPASASTDAQVHQLAVMQNRDGSWPWNLPRPPIQSSDIGATALAIQAIKNYSIPGRQREFDQRVERARAWLASARAESNEERTYQLLGLAWAGEPAGELTARAEALIREQRSDGGWGQLAGLPSDAFATGQSLFALMRAGAMPPTHPAVRRGIEFLVRTQLDDGTWHVRRRAFPFQPPMQSSFPHGADGWISGAATSWAVMALASAIDPSSAAAVSPALAKASGTPTAASAVAVGDASVPVEFARDIQPLLERSCVSCHTGERPKGGLNLVNRASLLQGGNRGEPVIVASHSEKSPLVQFVSDQVEDLEMPPVPKRAKFPALTKPEIARLRAWIDQGAIWPEEAKIRVSNP